MPGIAYELGNPLFMRTSIKEKINSIQALIDKMENKKNFSLIEILKEEIIKLKNLNDQYKSYIDTKKVVHTDSLKNKTRYHLKDGSTYVVNKNGKYRYLYDASTKIITYEFSNGQIEKTFPGGIKEIRYPDGTITIRNGEKDYDCIK
ncbi:hypothetical protein CWI38_0382p0080 [Hamiltosporidium tvaerminnensis]|uniref:T-complex protein 10 n=2 Tax=Hamiltosporidium TaxID=1176354 RepID=A0A4Q9LBE8_9MICR|nr:hypothetical protein LUQ84_000420 [Hamiltosporidium tvaerminnensis]TBU00518.1 hypothetical protein CWI39_1657p0020 [Hamiltosporidium magnivora]TBU04221.1 hypothetical protein CWI37_0168p0080 [Hamiltosporidium tvaerminnensis]TBU05149.1 hypothetical protein CWI36_0669p0010 [Hamiltosporidium magnivora]TBU11758.1 hypothetical protein CWI38_1051p0020 [Hamiltosporidium tvaerminnensis]